MGQSVLLKLSRHMTTSVLQLTIVYIYVRCARLENVHGPLMLVNDHMTCR